MSEQPQPNPRWEGIKAELAGFRLRARFMVDRVANQATDEVKYHLQVSPEAHEQASLLAEVFAGEAMDFLKRDLTGKLQPLRPTREQLELCRYLVDSIDSGNLNLRATQGGTWANGRPFAIREYQAEEQLGPSGGSGVDRGDSLKRKVSLTVRWGVEEGSVPGFLIIGRIGRRRVKGIDFIALPQKTETEAVLRQQLGLPTERNGFKSTLGAYDQGKRLIVTWEGESGGEHVVNTDQYFLIGDFEGEGTKRTYWLYGSNRETQSRMTVSVGVV